MWDVKELTFLKSTKWISSIIPKENDKKGKDLIPEADRVNAENLCMTRCYKALTGIVQKIFYNRSTNSAGISNL